jgi:hypothetical protein
VCANRREAHIAVKSADRGPVNEGVNNSAAVRPCGADFKPAAMLLAFPFQGKSGVRGCFVVGHAKELARFTGAGKYAAAPWR